MFLCIRRGYEAVCIERIDGRWVQSMALQLGGSLPLHVGAAPRVLLAHEPRGFWDEYLAQGPLAALTPNTPRARSSLVRALEQVRDAGCAVSDEDVVLRDGRRRRPIFDHRARSGRPSR